MAQALLRFRVVADHVIPTVLNALVALIIVPDVFLASLLIVTLRDAFLKLNALTAKTSVLELAPIFVTLDFSSSKVYAFMEDVSMAILLIKVADALDNLKYQLVPSATPINSSQMGSA